MNQHLAESATEAFARLASKARAMVDSPAPVEEKPEFLPVWRAVAEYRAAGTLVGAAKALGVDTRTIASRLKAARVRIARHARRRRSQDELDRIILAFEAGGKMRALAAELHLTGKTLTRILREAGAIPRGRGLLFHRGVKWARSVKAARERMGLADVEDRIIGTLLGGYHDRL